MKELRLRPNLEMMASHDGIGGWSAFRQVPRREPRVAPNTNPRADIAIAVNTAIKAKDGGAMDQHGQAIVELTELLAQHPGEIFNLAKVQGAKK